MLWPPLGGASEKSWSACACTAMQPVISLPACPARLRAAPRCAVQVSLLRESFKRALGPEGAKMVDINTIDGFQAGYLLDFLLGWFLLRGGGLQTGGAWGGVREATFRLQGCNM